MQGHLPTRGVASVIPNDCDGHTKRCYCETPMVQWKHTALWANLYKTDMELQNECINIERIVKCGEQFGFVKTVLTTGLLQN